MQGKNYDLSTNKTYIKQGNSGDAYDVAIYDDLILRDLHFCSLWLDLLYDDLPLVALPSNLPLYF